MAARRKLRGPPKGEPGEVDLRRVWGSLYERMMVKWPAPGHAIPSKGYPVTIPPELDDVVMATYAVAKARRDRYRVERARLAPALQRRRGRPRKGTAEEDLRPLLKKYGEHTHARVLVGLLKKERGVEISHKTLTAWRRVLRKKTRS